VSDTKLNYVIKNSAQSLNAHLIPKEGTVQCKPHWCSRYVIGIVNNWGIIEITGKTKVCNEISETSVL